MMGGIIIIVTKTTQLLTSSQTKLPPAFEKPQYAY